MEFFKENIIPGEVLVQLLAFLIVFFVLRALAWKPIMAALESRREKIRSDFEKIEAAKAEIEKLKADYERHLQQIEDQARAKLQETVEEGRKVARAIQEKARAESQASFEKAKENLALEIAKSRLELRRELADLTIQVAEKVIGEKMTEAKQQEKIMAMIDELEKAR